MASAFADLGLEVDRFAIDEDAIRAWRAQDEHGLMRETGRRAWYTRYMLQIARVERSYSWDSDEEHSDAEPATA